MEHDDQRNSVDLVRDAHLMNAEGLNEDSASLTSTSMSTTRTDVRPFSCTCAHTPKCEKCTHIHTHSARVSCVIVKVPRVFVLLPPIRRIGGAGDARSADLFVCLRAEVAAFWGVWQYRRGGGGGGGTIQTIVLQPRIELGLFARYASPLPLA